MDFIRRFWEALGAESRQQKTEAARGGENSSQIDKAAMNASTSKPPDSPIDPSLRPPSVERYIRADGKIGVVISHGFYGGWSTKLRLVLDPSDPTNWPRTRRMQEIAVFDKDIVAAVLAGDIQRARAVALEKMGLSEHFSPPAFSELRVEWVTLGDEFEVTDDSGCEKVRLKNSIYFWRA